MSQIFKRSQAARFTPKTIQFSKLYKSNTRGGKLGDNILINAKAALSQSGYSDSQISQIITTDQPVPVKQMKEVAQALSRSKVYGFEKNQNRAIKKFLNQERVKAQNIAQIRKEHILEAAEENLAALGTTSLNQKAIGPNTAKPGQASVLARRRGSAAAYSLASQSDSTKTESLVAKTASANINRPGIGRCGSTSGGVIIKPKF